MCWCHVVFHSHPAVGCTFTVCSTASCLNWQQCMYPFGNRYKKWLSQSHHLHAPLVHQGNNRLIQRLRSGPWVWITLSRGGWVSQSVDTGAPYTHFDSNSNSNKQRDKKQTLTPNTPVKTAVFRRHTQTQITSMYFPSGTWREDQWAHLSGLRRKVLPQFVILDRNPRKQTGWELSLKWGEATSFIILSALDWQHSCVCYGCHIFMCNGLWWLVEKVSYIFSCTFQPALSHTLLWCGNTVPLNVFSVRMLGCSLQNYYFTVLILCYGCMKKCLIRTGGGALWFSL